MKTYCDIEGKYVIIKKKRKGAIPDEKTASDRKCPY